MSEMARRVEPEWLDELPPEDARAIRSRRDLVRVNALMSNAGIVASLLEGALPSRPLRIAELGAGDGRFSLRLAGRLAGRTGHWMLVDRAPCVDESLGHDMAPRGWTVDTHRADVFDWLAHDLRCDAIVANLFLHHFDDARLRELLRLASERAALFVACEPRRSALALAGSRLLGLLGCNDVTRHDAVVSVRAGFTGEEVSALWPKEGAMSRDERGGCPRWDLLEGPRGWFSHAFRARRA